MALNFTQNSDGRHKGRSKFCSAARNSGERTGARNEFSDHGGNLDDEPDSRDDSLSAPTALGAAFASGGRLIGGRYQLHLIAAGDGSYAFEKTCVNGALHTFQ